MLEVTPWDLPDRIVGAAACSANPEARAHNPVRWRRWSTTFDQAFDFLRQEFGTVSDVRAEGSEELISADRSQWLIDELRRPARRDLLAALDADFVARLERMQLFWASSRRIDDLLQGNFTLLQPRRPVVVIIPFRDTSASQSRWVNLQTCLTRLKPQLQGNDRCVVVEADSGPRHEEAIRASGFDYEFVSDVGPFNKSKLVNRGAAEVSLGEILCILDSDTYFGDDFIEGAVRSHVEGALLPHENILFMTDISSDKLRAGRADTATPKQFYVTGGSKGICVVVDQPSFAKVQGFDERFEGWGGEDRDFVDRVGNVAPVTRLSMNLAHLDHERPVMVDDGS